MLENAIAKIKAEIEKGKNNSYIQVVGGFLLQHLDKNPQDAEKILTEGKTIGKSLDEMRKEAEKKKVGNCAVLTDQEGFAVVLKYFGIEGIVTTPAQVAATATPAPTPPVAESVFDVKLDDLL